MSSGQGWKDDFRRWRGHRPFLGGLLLVLGGAEILLTMKAPLPVILHIGMQGLAGYLIPTLMVVCGLLILFNPSQRLFYSVVAVLLSLGAWPTSNLGGFFVGLLLGVAGSCLTFGWLPDQEPRVSRRQRRKNVRKPKHFPQGTVGEQRVPELFLKETDRHQPGQQRTAEPA